MTLHLDLHTPCPEVLAAHCLPHPPGMKNHIRAKGGELLNVDVGGRSRHTEDHSTMRFDVTGSPVSTRRSRARGAINTCPRATAVGTRCTHTKARRHCAMVQAPGHASRIRTRRSRESAFAMSTGLISVRQCESQTRLLGNPFDSVR